MSDVPVYLWAVEIAAAAAVPTATAAVLYAGAGRAGLTRRRAGLLAGSAAALFGAWTAATVIIAAHGWYRGRLGHGVPWMPVAILAATGILLALSRTAAVVRVLAAPGMLSRLVLPHAFRVAGVVFLVALALGQLPAVFAVPAGLGDIGVGLAAPLVARRIAEGTGVRAARRFNLLGLADLSTALTLGGLTAFHVLHVTPSGDAITELPYVLIPTAVVPLLIVLHLTSVSALRGAARTQSGSQALAAALVAAPGNG